MADGDANEADALARLEAALDRIAQHNQRTISAPEATPGVDIAAIASRLDNLIGQLRDALEVEA